MTGSLPCYHSRVGESEVAGRAGRRSATNPATGAAFAEVSLLDPVQVAEVVTAAQTAFPAWRNRPFRQRRRSLMQARQRLLDQADEIARLIAREQGKPVAEAWAVEVYPSLETLRHLADDAEEALRDEPVEARVALFAHKDCRVRYVPFGVVLVITPWNYPFGIALSIVATALAAGNTVILKPAPAATLVGLRVGDIFRGSGLPDGALSVVAVDDEVAAGLTEDPRLGKMVFTGSVATGRKVMATAARQLKPTILELGGKDAAIVCRDADLDRAASGVVWGAFLNAGQTCASVERVYVEERVAETFIASVVAETRRLRMGDPLSSEVDVGPMTLLRQRVVVEEHVADALSRGAQALIGGSRPGGEGFFYPPTVLTRVDHSMRVMREETFGPVLPIMRVASPEEAVGWANQSDYGLTASVWTRDPETADRLERDLQAGVVMINDCVSSNSEPTAPWGGFKQSGIGRVHGRIGLREMVQVQYLSRDWARSRALWWYPYDEQFTRSMTLAGRALHARGLFKRILNLCRLLLVRRFLERVRIRDLLRSADRLF